MIIGYARVSKQEQKLELQKDALEKCGCEEIFTDTISGSKADRPGLKEAIRRLRAGDTFVVWKLDRLGRSIQHLIQTIKLFNEKGIIFKSLQDTIDTSTASGKLVFHLFCALAEFERDLIIERTHAGLTAARSRGKFGGRNFKLNLKEIERMKKIYEEKKIYVPEICRMFKISKQTLYNYIGNSNEKSS